VTLGGIEDLISGLGYGTSGGESHGAVGNSTFNSDNIACNRGNSTLLCPLLGTIVNKDGDFFYPISEGGDLEGGLVAGSLNILVGGKIEGIYSGGSAGDKMGVIGPA
jgi:hypothetical protein